MHPFVLDHAVGAIFVVIYSVTRFNTPPTNRSSTTAGRYFLALFLYSIAALVTFVLLAEFPHLVRFLLGGDAAADSGTKLQGYLQELSSPLVAALMMTVLLPNLPLLSTLDRWIFRELQSIAAIPYEVRRLSAELRGRPFTVPPDLQAETRRRLEDEGIAPQDARFERGTTPPQLWTTITALFIRLESWESDPRMASYIDEFDDSLQALRARRQALLPKAKICFRLLSDAGTANSDKAAEAIQRFAADFSEQATQLRNGLIDFVSRGILRSEMTDAGRASRLTAIGFPAHFTHEALTLNQMMSLFCMVGVLMLGGSIAFSANPGLGHGLLLLRIVMISIIYSAAVACAVLPKDDWSFAQRGPRGERPIVFYVVAGIMAVGISQAIGLGFNCLIERSLTNGATRWLYTYPWALMTFATAVGIAFLVDDAPPARWPRWIGRTLEGLAQSAVMLTAAYMTQDWLQERVTILGPFSDYRVPPLASVLANSAIVGFFIGFLVPTWYREAPRERAITPEPAPMLCPPAGAEAGIA